MKTSDVLQVRNTRRGGIPRPIFVYTLLLTAHLVLNLFPSISCKVRTALRRPTVSSIMALPSAVVTYYRLRNHILLRNENSFIFNMPHLVGITNGNRYLHSFL
jgi:hypothetical protein